jgi:hypothetical protein
MNVRLFSMITLFTLACSQVFGHALWIETSPTGKKGQPQEVRVFWGEYADKDISPVDKWWSDTKSYTLTLITPDKKEIKLTSAPGSDHYKAVFTPESDGVYTVLLQHSVKDVYNGSRLDYHSSAAVVVGKSNTGHDATANKNPISIYSIAKGTYKVNEAITLQALLDKLPAGNKEVEVFAPNGWGKKLWTDSTGSAKFTPIWPGRYFVEVASTDEKKSGEHNGKPYQKVWRCATYCIEVTK